MEPSHSLQCLPTLSIHEALRLMQEWGLILPRQVPELYRAATQPGRVPCRLRPLMLLLFLVQTEPLTSSKH